MSRDKGQDVAAQAPSDAALTQQQAIQAYTQLESALAEAADMPQLRFSPTGPGGLRGSLSATEMAQLGAIVASMGGEQQAVLSLLQSCQSAAIQAMVSALPRILSEAQDMQRQSYNRIIQEIQHLPQVTVPMSGSRWGQVLGMQSINTPTIAYISLESVLRIIMAAAGRGLPQVA